MELAALLARYAFALGHWQAAWRFASCELRQAIALGQVSAAWKTFRRDAGPGMVGREHADPNGKLGITCTDDPRRANVLLWLADYGSPTIADAAGALARMVGAERRFGSDEQELLQVACDALTPGMRPGPVARLLPRDDTEADEVFTLLNIAAAAVDRLRNDPAFVESSGAQVRHRLPRGATSYYVPAEPGATWALNLALLTHGPWLQGAPPVVGLVSRMLFRPEDEPEEVAAALVDGATAALRAAYVCLASLSAELDRGNAALAHMSRNSRARETWLLLAALRSSTRSQLGRGLGLSRAGTDIQMRALADLGLATLSRGGRVDWHPEKAIKGSPAPLTDGPLRDAAADLDTPMADIDRLLARTAG